MPPTPRRLGAGPCPGAVAAPLVPLGTERVLAAGSTDAGRTTMARTLSGILGVPHVALDALVHGPGWTPRPEFAADVAAMLAIGRGSPSTSTAR